MCIRDRLGDAQLEGLFEAVRQQVCASCERAQRCWGNDYFTTCRLLYEMLSDLEYDGSVSAQMEGQLQMQCRRAQQLSLIHI